MASKNKSYFWSGTIFTCMGVALFWLVISLDFTEAPQKQYFDACMGLIFLYVGIKRIKKSRQPDDKQEKSLNRESSVINQTNSPEVSSVEKETIEIFEPAETGTPLFIKCVAFSPALPLAVGLIGATACGLLGYRESCVFGSGQEGLVYLGVLGWLLTLPLAGLLKFIYSSSKL